MRTGTLPSLMLWTAPPHTDVGAQKGSVTVGGARRSTHLGGGKKGATSVLWKAAICQTPASLTKTRKLSS